MGLPRFWYALSLEFAFEPQPFQSHERIFLALAFNLNPARLFQKFQSAEFLVGGHPVFPEALVGNER